MEGNGIASCGCNTRRVENELWCIRSATEEIGSMIRGTMAYTVISPNLDSDIGALDGGSGKESSDSDGEMHFDIY